MKKIIALILCICCVAICFASCSSKTEDNSTQKEVITQKGDDFTVTHKATIEMQNGAKIELELYGNLAPESVRNFVKLANEKFYDGIIFHRVIADFMIQAGDPTGTGTGGSETKIKGEFSQNGVNNTLKHEPGVISMARTSDPNSASSQFFICLADCTYLDGQYAAFGKVTSGMEEVQRIGLVKTNSSDKPLQDEVIKTITESEVK